MSLVPKRASKDMNDVEDRGTCGPSCTNCYYTSANCDKFPPTYQEKSFSLVKKHMTHQGRSGQNNNIPCPLFSAMHVLVRKVAMQADEGILCDLTFAVANNTVEIQAHA